MRADACREWRGALASAALGPMGEDEPVGLRAHLDGCRACRRELAELTAVARMLPAADVERVVDDPVEPSHALADRVLHGVARERDRRRAHRSRVVALAAAAVIALVLGIGAVVAVTNHNGRGPAHTNVVFTSTGEGRAHATLTPRPEGTEVALTVSGLHHGDWYWLWLTGGNGKRIPAGSFEGAPTSHLRMLSALPLADARRIWVTDDADHVVFDARVPSQT
jgi:anti-sigma-K factor RskA/putative zinc finger protein